MGVFEFFNRLKMCFGKEYDIEYSLYDDVFEWRNRIRNRICTIISICNIRNFKFASWKLSLKYSTYSRKEFEFTLFFKLKQFQRYDDLSVNIHSVLPTCLNAAKYKKVRMTEYTKFRQIQIYDYERIANSDMILGNKSDTIIRRHETAEYWIFYDIQPQ